MLLLNKVGYAIDGEFVLLMLADITIVEHLIDFKSGVQANF